MSLKDLSLSFNITEISKIRIRIVYDLPGFHKTQPIMLENDLRTSIMVDIEYSPDACISKIIVLTSECLCDIMKRN